MPRFPRLVVPGYPHHITQRGVRKNKTFFDASDYRAYLHLAAELSDEWPIEIWAYCLMPNHMHAVVAPGQQESLARFFARLHQQYARRTNARYGWQGHMWQKRFYSVVMDEPHAVCALRYVELNPVRAGLCRSAQQWPWSSARANLGLAVDPLISRAHTEGLVADWHALLRQREDNDNLRSLRHHTGTGRPTGSVEFLKTIETLSGRRIQKRRSGRKRT